MDGRDIQKNFPLVYELVKAITFPRDIREIEENNKKVSSMSTQELMDYDAKLYKARQGKDLNWDKLETYTEKMQWAKLFDDDPRKVTLSDKYLVREWIKNTIGEEYLIPLLGKWESYDKVEFDKLPNEFVIKTNHGSSDAVIVRNKSSMTLADKLRMKRIIKTSMKRDYGTYACELHYSKINPLIICEQYIDSGETDLQDYKFLCFDGVPYYCWVDVGRYTDHKRNVYDMNWQLQEWNQFHYGNSSQPIQKPVNFEKMVEIATTLSKGFSHVRVDLYNVDGKIYFGEMTFTNGSGFEEIAPPKYDYVLGDLWKIATNSR